METGAMKITETDGGLELVTRTEMSGHGFEESLRLAWGEAEAFAKQLEAFIGMDFEFDVEHEVVAMVNEQRFIFWTPARCLEPRVCVRNASRAPAPPPRTGVSASLTRAQLGPTVAALRALVAARTEGAETA